MRSLHQQFRQLKNGLTVTPFQYLSINHCVTDSPGQRLVAQALRSRSRVNRSRVNNFSNPGLGDLLELLATHGLPGYFDEFRTPP